MSNKTTVLKKMSFNVWSKALEFLINSDVYFSDSIFEDNIYKITFFKYNLLENTLSLTDNHLFNKVKFDHISMRIHSDLRKHNLSSATNVPNSRIDQEFSDLNELISKQKQKYISLLVNRFEVKPTIAKARAILREFPICFEGIQNAGRFKLLKTNDVVDEKVIKMFSIQLKDLESKLVKVGIEIDSARADELKIRDKIRLLENKRSNLKNEIKQKTNLVKI